MAEQDTDAVDTTGDAKGGNDSSGETPAADNGFRPITSQEELNAIIKQRIERERAKYRDYAELKAEAEEARKLKQANMTELEKANARAVEVEKERDSVARERDEARAEALRLRIAVQHGLSIEDADLFLTGTDEETLTAQAKRLADRAAAQANADAERRKRSPYVPDAGTSTNAGGSARDEELAFARAFFSGGTHG